VSFDQGEAWNRRGVCASLYPAGNIVIEDHKLRFHNQCEMCFVCDEWFPQGPIQHWSRQKGIKYHHPEVSSSDMEIMSHQRIEKGAYHHGCDQSSKPFN
jgi:MinD superfamily P-loop ATPase